MSSRGQSQQQPSPGAGRADAGRKIAACEGCRKQKIRCDMDDLQAPCARCRKKRLKCLVKPDFESYVEDDLLWKRDTERKLRELEARLFTTASLDEEVVFLQNGRTDAPDRRNIEVGTSSQPTPKLMLTVDLDSSPGTLPGIAPAVSTERRITQPGPDIISRGVITPENARQYHAIYRDRLDHFLYGVLGDRRAETFEELHEKSPMLSTAVCAVGALHAPSDDYGKLHQEVVTLVASISFMAKHTVDDVRALCISAFWISDLSASLSSLAVRIAIELQLHRSFNKAVQGDYQHYHKARLYYLVYTCDHHLSIPHGRPPLTRECDAVRKIRQFLNCKFANHDDMRLASQVSRWSTWSEIHDTFGQDTDVPLTAAQTLMIRRLCIKLDTLRLEWAEKLGIDEHVGNYPWKGAAMQHYFVKLYLCSHIFRGLGLRPSTVEVDKYEIASSAVLAATCILRIVTEDQEVQSYLNGLPTYHHVMVAFAVVFLLKVATQFASMAGVNIEDTQSLLTSTITTLRSITSEMHPQHHLVTITDGAADAVARSSKLHSTLSREGSPVLESVHGDTMINDSLDEFFNTYDFLADHTI